MSRNSNCMIGRYVPFFLTNGNSTPQYYLYAFESPGLSKNLYPYLSMRKVGERVVRTKGEFPVGNGNDILQILVTEETKNQKMDWRVVLVLLNLFKRSSFTVEKNGRNFPLIEYKGDNFIQKMLAAGLRSLVRKRYYNLRPCKKLDILWSRDEYVVFNIKGGAEKNVITLEPEAVYEITDLNRENPLPVDLSKVNVFGDRTFTLVDDWNITKELDEEIKKLEMFSFDRRKSLLNS